MSVLENNIRGLILVVEDNAEDYEATVRALEKAGVKKDIRRCEDGDDAIDYLSHQGAYAQADAAPRPEIILLDLNMPGTDGFEVLETVKHEDGLKTIPIVVLTTSNSERDVELCYRAGANSYIQKPVDLDGFVKTIRRLKEYWFDTVVLS